MEKTTYTTYTGTPPTAVRSTTVVNQQPPTVVQQHTTYTPSTVQATHVSVVNQQPAVVHHHVYQSGPTLGGFLSSVGQAVSTVAVETSRVVAQVVQPVVAVECFMPGFVVELRSKVSGKKLALGKDGLVNCSGDGGATCHFKIISTGRAGVYKLRNVAQPNCYLGYVKGFIVGYGTGDNIFQY
ncbi:uncharacterized protein [Dysidea avara]|uniref:uncharacterized protein isoform X2 n=1 Tax=Dysidea avara TaxID=196820 RepID=UPI003319CEE4